MSDGGIPFQRPGSASNDFTTMVFLVNQLLRGKATATLVRVEACTNDGGLVPTGTVDVTPLVNQVDGAGQPVPHSTVYGLLYQRAQGGNNAVILDPQPGDLGVAVFASRDISAVKVSKGQANPGSSRVMDYADGIYLGGVLNGTPTSYVQFQADGSIAIHSPVKVVVSAPEVDLTADTVVNIQAPTINLKGAVVQTAGDVSMAQNLAVTGNASVGGGLSVTGATTGGGSATFTGDVTAAGTSVHNHHHLPGAYVAGATPVTGNSGNPV
jgi:hypothetical protein